MRGSRARSLGPCASCAPPRHPGPPCRAPPHRTGRNVPPRGPCRPRACVPSPTPRAPPAPPADLHGRHPRVRRCARDRAPGGIGRGVAATGAGRMRDVGVGGRRSSAWQPPLARPRPPLDAPASTPMQAGGRGGRLGICCTAGARRHGSGALPPPRPLCTPRSLQPPHPQPPARRAGGASRQAQQRAQRAPPPPLPHTHAPRHTHAPEPAPPTSSRRAARWWCAPAPWRRRSSTFGTMARRGSPSRWAVVCVCKGGGCVCAWRGGGRMRAA